MEQFQFLGRERPTYSGRLGMNWDDMALSLSPSGTGTALVIMLLLLLQLQASAIVTSTSQTRMLIKARTRPCPARPARRLGERGPPQHRSLEDTHRIADAAVSACRSGPS